jgi:hypothetical protein
VPGSCRSNLFSLPFLMQHMPREHKVVNCCYKRSFAATKMRPMRRSTRRMPPLNVNR